MHGKKSPELEAPAGLAEMPNPARLVAAGPSRGLRASVTVGFCATLILHLGVVVLVPDEFFRVARAVERQPAERLTVFLEEPEEAEPTEEFIFTNPDVPANPPDEAPFFSDRNQQAAQEEETDEGDPAQPHVEGEEPEPTQNIIESETVPPSEELWETLPGDDGEGLATEALPELSVPGFEPVDEDEGMEVPVTPEGEPVEELVFGIEVETGETEERPAEESGAPGQEAVEPRPRPSLPQFSRGPVGVREGAAPRVGRVAVDANFSEYGDYLARMIDAIVQQWHLLAWDSLPAGEVGTVVAVTFRIDAAGEVHGLAVENSTASLVATLICQDAISSRQPYGPWTSDMREVLGEEQTIQIRFLYR